MDDTKEWIVSTNTNRLLGLPHNILLNILQLLPKETVYEACLVHDGLTSLAQSVLWEAPRFQSDLSIKPFFETVRTSKRLGLLVQSLYLCEVTTDDAIFPIVSKSSLSAHQQQNDHILSNPKMIVSLTKACEKITSLTIYSDKIELTHIEQVTATAIHLTTLTLIGSKTKEAPYITGLLSRIQSLTLDGPFIISELWATQMKRATELTTLQISLSNIEINVLDKLCRNIPLLTSLTFTDAAFFTDEDVRIVAHLFPKLKSFQLQGSDNVTEISLFHALSICPELQHLKLRANANRNRLPAKYLERYGTPPDHIIIHLQTLVLENIMMEDDWFFLMSSKLKQVKYVGFKSCPNLTDQTIHVLLERCPQLTDIHIEDCPHLSLGSFIGMMDDCPSLRRISCIRSGQVAAAFLHHIFTMGNLFMLRVSATPELRDLVGRNSDRNVIEFNKQGIKQFIQTNQTLDTISDRYLTAYQVTQLADKLDVPIDVLNTILEGITGRTEIFDESNSSLDYSGYSNKVNEEEEEEEEEVDRDEIDTNHSSQIKSSENSFISQDWHNSFDENILSDTEGTYSKDDENEAYTKSSKDGFSVIPDWADANDQLGQVNDWPDRQNGKVSRPQEWHANNTWTNYHNQDEPWEEQGNNIEHSQNNNSGVAEDWYQQEMNKPEEEGEEEEWVPDDHDETIPTLADWQSQINSTRAITNGNKEQWPLLGDQKPLVSKTTTKPNNAWENVPNTIRNSSTSMSHQTNVCNVWNPQVAEAEVRQLTGTAMSGQLIRAKQLGHGRTQPRVLDDGWGGTPDKYVAWDDVNQHGFNKEVLEKQKNTIFWRKDNGVWKECDQGMAETSTNTGEAPPMNSQGHARSRRRADSYQSSADSCTEDHNRNKLARDARLTPDSPENTKWLHDKYEGSVRKPNENISDWNTFKETSKNGSGLELNEARHSQRSPNNQWHGGSSTEGSIEQSNGSFFTKNKRYSKNNSRNTRKTRQIIPPGKMAGQWGDYVGQETPSPEQEPKPSSPQQTDVSLVDIIDEFSPNRMDVHQNMHPPVTSQWNPNNNLAKMFDDSSNNQVVPSVNTDVTLQQSSESTTKLSFDEWDSIVSSNSRSSSSMTISPKANDFIIPTLQSQAATTTNATTTTTTTASSNNNNTHVFPASVASSPVPPASPAPSSPSPSALFSTKLKMKIHPTKVDTLYINKDNVREKIAQLMHQYDMYDEERLEKMVADVTSYVVKKETDNVFNVKKKGKLV